MTRTLLVVDPSTGTAEAEACEQIAGLFDGQTRIATPALDGPADVGPLDGLSGVILLGSSASVHDPSPWRDALSRRLMPLVTGQRRLPLLGICYGHQLVARLTGARVAQVLPDGGKLIDIRTIQVEAGCPLFDPGWRGFRAAVSHAEMVTELPTGFRRIATHDECANHGMQHERLPIFTLQSHPEMPPVAFERLGYDGPEDPERLAHGRRILERFLALCR